MLAELLSCLEAEVMKKDPRVTGLELVYPESRLNRLHLIVSVRAEHQETRLSVTVSMDDVRAGKMLWITGVILQAVDLGTWGARDYQRVRESVSVTA